uniref:Uncharacterized protein n=1 Tax=Solanum tuberosum TaxID=4113 RepID=M1DMI2_SOLTU
MLGDPWTVGGITARAGHPWFLFGTQLLGSRPTETSHVAWTHPRGVGPGRGYCLRQIPQGFTYAAPLRGVSH